LAQPPPPSSSRRAKSVANDHLALAGDDNKSFAEKLNQEFIIAASNGLPGDRIRQSLYSTRLSSLAFKKTYAATSTVSGLGLFAASDIVPGEILTCYPGDAIIIRKDENDSILWGSHIPDERIKTSERIRSTYLLATGIEDWSIVALPELGTNDASYLGHYANDGADPPSCEAELSTYVLASQERSNAMHRDWENCHMVTIATKSIKEGEEIFVSYGPVYWMQQESFGTLGKKRRRKRKDQSGIGNGKGFG